jgi:hypothetical protein
MDEYEPNDPPLNIGVIDRLFVVHFNGFDEVPTHITHPLLIEKLSDVFYTHIFITKNLLICRNTQRSDEAKKPTRCPFWEIFKDAIPDEIEWAASLAVQFEYSSKSHLKIDGFLEGTGGGQVVHQNLLAGEKPNFMGAWLASK